VLSLFRHTPRIQVGIPQLFIYFAIVRLSNFEQLLYDRYDSSLETEFHTMFGYLCM